MSEPDLSTQMKRHLWLAENPGVNKLINRLGAIVGYADGELWGFSHDVEFNGPLKEGDWKPYIEPPKPKWYEAAKPGMLFRVSGMRTIFEFLEYHSEIVFIIDADGIGHRPEISAPIPSSEIQRYLDLAIELEKQGVS